MLLGSGSIRATELNPIVLYGDLVEAFPYDDEIYMSTVSGGKLKNMIRYMLRDEVWKGVHCEFYQFSEGFRVVYDRENHRFLEFSLNGEEIPDDKLYTIGLQRFHFQNVDLGFGVTQEELAEVKSPRVVATSCRDVLDEYLSHHQRLDRHTGERLVIN